MSRRPPQRSLRQLGIVEATRRIARPLARAAAREGLGIEEFVATAREAFLNPGLSGDDPNEDGGRVDYPTALRVAGRWISGSPYATKGRPRSLPLRGRGSFAELADQVGANADVLLSQLLAVGAVRRDPRGTVSLVAPGYVPAKGVGEKLDMLGRDAAEFVETVLHNLDADPIDSRLQRKASYDNIGSSALPALRRRLRSLAMGALLDANALLARADRDRNPNASGGRRTRVSFGVYIGDERVAATTAPRTRKRRVPRG